MCVRVYTPETINDFDFVCISYNMGMSALPDMYARRAEDIHIRHSTSAHVIINVTLQSLFKSANPLNTLVHSTYILEDTHCDCGILF